MDRGLLVTGTLRVLLVTMLHVLLVTGTLRVLRATMLHVHLVHPATQPLARRADNG